MGGGTISSIGRDTSSSFALGLMDFAPTRCAGGGCNAKRQRGPFGEPSPAYPMAILQCDGGACDVLVVLGGLDKAFREALRQLGYVAPPAPAGVR